MAFFYGKKKRVIGLSDNKHGLFIYVVIVPNLVWCVTICIQTLEFSNRMKRQHPTHGIHALQKRGASELTEFVAESANVGNILKRGMTEDDLKYLREFVFRKQMKYFVFQTFQTQEQ